MRSSLPPPGGECLQGGEWQQRRVSERGQQRELTSIRACFCAIAAKTCSSTSFCALVHFLCFSLPASFAVSAFPSAPSCWRQARRRWQISHANAAPPLAHEPLLTYCAADAEAWQASWPWPRPCPCLPLALRHGRVQRRALTPPPARSRQNLVSTRFSTPADREGVAGGVRHSNRHAHLLGLRLRGPPRPPSSRVVIYQDRARGTVRSAEEQLTARSVQLPPTTHTRRVLWSEHPTSSFIVVHSVLRPDVSLAIPIPLPRALPGLTAGAVRVRQTWTTSSTAAHESASAITSLATLPCIPSQRIHLE